MMTLKQQDQLLTEHKVAIDQIKSLKESSRKMQAELIELKDINAGQTNLLDALENLPLDHGYELNA
ncbi:MAG: hypothetical protein HRU18_16775 [Pseudoalteromonas sp.]|uniref:hypothetical protein n=1 Tax=Pseudoalteromonas sp. TaxID=53249 RepID=UPI001DEEED66|nr:hypothetical protein [Pseudoalteromonas sp.]NRA79861.1 hypothetical protein [Pseudoalteromonas sp.]